MNARRTVIAVMGALMGAAGIEHGVGEFLQGGVSSEGFMIRSWPDAPFFASLNGEPALTIVPDLRLTGVLAVGVSLLFTIWAIGFATRKHAGLGLILLAVPMLLLGGGIFPPILGACIGAAAAATQRPPKSQQLSSLRRWPGQAWPWLFGMNCLAWLALLPGVAVLEHFFGIDNMLVTLAIMVAAFTLLFVSFWSSVQHDRLASSCQSENDYSKPVVLAHSPRHIQEGNR